MDRLYPEVAIILVTKNGRRTIQEVLEAIFGQATGRPFEVVLIDSESTDGTWEIAQKFPIRAHRIPAEEFDHGETRNLGAQLASSTVRYLVYLTQDATPLEGWLDNLLWPLEEDEQVAGAFSRHVPRPGCSPSMARLICTEWVQAGTPERVVKHIDNLDEYEQNQAFHAYFSNTSSVLRRTVWAQFPFARVEFAEDSEWADRVLRAGYTLVYEPSSRVLHSHNYSLWQQLAQNVDHARAMKDLHNPSGYQEVRPGRSLRRVAEQTRKDWLYIAAMQMPWGRKVYWGIHAPLWQLATEIGSQVGAHADSLPQWVVTRLSRQSKVRRDNG